MKYILLLLISLNTSAEIKYSRVDAEGKSQGHFIAADETAGNERLLSMISGSGWMKCEWKSEEPGSVAYRVQEGLEEEDITTYCHPLNFAISKADVTEQLAQEAAAKALADAIDQKLKCGQDSIKYIAGRNVMKGLTTEQIKSMAQTYGLVNDLLRSGAIDTAITEISGLTPDGIIVTPQDKTEILAKISECN